MVGRQPSHMRQLERDEGITPAKGASSVTPCSVYPPLHYKPLPLPPSTQRQEYQLTLLKVDIERSKRSMFCMCPTEVVSRTDRYTDKYQQTVQVPPLTLHWRDLPQELWPTELRPKSKKRKRKRAQSKANLASEIAREKILRGWLKILENKTEKEHNCDDNVDIKRSQEPWRERLYKLEESYKKIQASETDEDWKDRLEKFEKERNTKLRGMHEDAWLKLEKDESGVVDNADDEGGEGVDSKKKIKTEEGEEEGTEEIEDEEEYDDEGDYLQDYNDSGDNANGDDEDGGDTGWY